MSVLRRTLEIYKLPFPTLDYSCSYIFAKKVWSGLSAYDLKTLCKINGIDLQHHRAASDSRATAELALKAFDIAGVYSIDDFSEKLQTSVGQLYDGGYKPSEARRNYKPMDSRINGDPTKLNSESIFYGKSIVFTGTLLSMVRSCAHQYIVDAGGIIGGNVTKDTNFLIVGQQDYKVVGDDGMSGKQEKAIKLIEKGSSLEIISETDFLKRIL